MASNVKALYGARVNFMDDGSVWLTVWVWDEDPRSPYRTVEDRVHRFGTEPGVDRLDQALYGLDRLFRRRLPAVRRRAARAKAQSTAPRAAAPAAGSMAGTQALPGL